MGLATEQHLGLANRFVLTLQDAEVPDLGSWAKAEGLDVTWDVAEYRAGDTGNHRWYLPGNTKYTNVKLTRAACSDSTKVKTWLDKVSFKHKFAQLATLSLRDSTGVTDVLTWEFRGILPVKWSIGSFDATASKVQTETLELAHLGFLDDEVKYAG